MNKLTQMNRGRSFSVKFLGIFAGLSALMATMMVTLADPFAGVTTELNSVITQFTGMLNTIVIPIAIAAATFCLIMMLVSQNQRKVEQYRTWLISIAVCVVLIFGIPFIIDLARQIGESFTA